MSKKSLRCERYKLIRQTYQVNAYTGAKVFYQGRPATIKAAAGRQFLILQLEDRIDKCEIRAPIAMVTFTEPFKKGSRLPTNKTKELEAREKRAEGDAFENGWW